jgi:hypothetical protein
MKRNRDQPAPMPKPIVPAPRPLPETSPQQQQPPQDLALQIFSISVGMVGLTLSCIGILRLLAHTTGVETIGDELLAAAAVLFMACCFSSFWSFKTKGEHIRPVLRRVNEVVFILALTIMVIVCALIAYEIA